VLCDVVPMHTTIYCLENLGNLIEKTSMMGLRTSILLKGMGRQLYLYHCPLDKCKKTSWNWKEKVKPKKKINHVRMWGRAKIKWAKREEC